MLVGQASDLARRVANYSRFAAFTLFQLSAVASASFATVLTPAVRTVRSPAPIPSVRILICLFLQASDLLSRLLSWRYVGPHRQLLMNLR